MIERRFAALWPDHRPLIGMVHLRPLPGSPGWGGSMDEVVEAATADATALAEGGMDGIIVENYGDVPFFAGEVPPETVAALTRAVAAVTSLTSVPVGVNVLRNDARAGLGIAAATGARFIRVNVHTGVMWTDQGVVEGRAAETLRARTALAPDVAIFADVHVKHAAPPPGVALEDAAADAWHRGLADALILSGTATGAPTDPTQVHDVSGVVPGAPILVGSGARPETVAPLLEVAHGVIVGSALAHEGRAGAGVDAEAVKRFVEAARATGG